MLMSEPAALPHGGDTIPSKVIYMAGIRLLNLLSKAGLNSKANLPRFLYDLL